MSGKAAKAVVNSAAIINSVDVSLNSDNTPKVIRSAIPACPLACKY